MPLPGDPDAIEDACRQLGAATEAMRAAGASVAGHGRAATADWSGLAAPLALARTQQDAANVQRVAEAANSALEPLTRYAEELRAAQADFARGEDMTTRGRPPAPGLGAQIDSAGRTDPDPAAEAARDGAHRTIDDGAALMRTAQERARVANEVAARALDSATASLAGIAAVPPTSPAAATASPLAEAGNIAASLGTAALEHPLDTLGVLGGVALAAAGATGVVGSLALDATGVGATAGLPLGAASAAGVAAGAGIAGAGLIDLTTHAATDSSVTPFRVDQETDASRIEERARSVGKPGKNKRVRVVETEEEIHALYDELAEGGAEAEWPDYAGRAVEFPDGTRIGLRDSSSSAPGSTVDIHVPGQPPRKVHREGF